jgi:hypothetical protein
MTKTIEQFSLPWRFRTGYRGSTLVEQPRMEPLPIPKGFQRYHIQAIDFVTILLYPEACRLRRGIALFCPPFSHSENLRAGLQVVLLQMVRQCCGQAEAVIHGCKSDFN